MDQSSDNDIPPSFKRQRLATSNEKGNVCSGVGVSSSEVDSTSGTQRERPDCQYGSNCFRRNENHLMQYRHPLLEDAFNAMKGAKDFNKLPSGFDVGAGDEAVIVEQATILRDAGFQTESQSQQERESSGAIGKKSPATSRSGPANLSQASVDKNDPLASLFEERKRRMKEKQVALSKIQSQRKSDPVAHAHGSLSGACSGLTRSMSEKWESSCPFNIFLTKVRDIPLERNDVLSANFVDLFDPSFGDVKAICHINFMVEANWLFEQSIRAGLKGKTTRIIYSDSDDSQIDEAVKAFPWLKVFKVKSPFPFGHHHTKMSFVQYMDESIRFYIYTANLIESDWDNRTQGIWISPKCPRVPRGSASSLGESVTNFRSDVMEYLTTYPVQATAAWRDIIKYADCSSIKTYFVASVPITSQSHFNGYQFGHKKMERILKSFELDTEPNWPLVAQCSSIGTLGSSANDWLVNEFGASMTGKDRCLKGPLDLVYPTDQNVKTSFDGVLGGGCLPYSAMTHMKQRWLERHLCQWKADCSGRSRAPPHIKSYSRWSPDRTKMAWFLLTSANLSKAAWGKLNKDGSRLTMMSWEAGVLFIPELITSTKYFVVNSDADSLQVKNKFPLYFDIPLVRYEKKDHPWFFETLKLAISE